MIGTTISHYKIVEKLGGGGMGVVYKAHDTRLKRTVALKFLPPDLTRDEEAKTRFTHEAQAASALQHPNICTIHDIDETADHQLFIVMDCYEGGTLKEKIEREPLPIEISIDIATQVAQGLAKAHTSGIVHRDIKPANIVVGEDGIARILDFGLAKLSSQTVLTKSGSTLGTAAYMSPEQARGEKVDQRTDIWSLGVVLYEMLAGRKPFASDYEQALVYSILNQTPEAMTTSRKDVPIKLEQIVSKCLEKEASRRYQTADDLLVDLKEARGGGAKVTQGMFGALLARTIWGRKKWARRAAVVAIPLVLILAWFVYSTYFGAPMERIPIAVISFENMTGDSTYNNLQDMIPSALITQLEQSSYLRVASWERMRDLLKQVGKAGAGFIDDNLGFDLAQRDSARALVKGTYMKAGNVFQIDAKIYDVVTRKLLKPASSKGEGVESILLSQIDELSKKILAGVDAPSTAAKAEVRPTSETITSSTEAWRYFARGRTYYEKFFMTDAIASLRKAVAIDTTYAIAYYYLCLALTQDGDPSARQALEKAMKYAGKASRKDQLTIEQLYAIRVERNNEKRSDILLQLEAEYPGDKYVLFDLGRYYRASQPQRAISYYSRALALDPSWSSASTELGYTYIDINELGKAVEVFKRDVEANPGNPNSFDNLGDVYFVVGKIDSSIIAKEEAKVVNPGWPSSDIGLVYLHALKEDYETAFKVIQRMQSDTATAGPGDFWKAFLDGWLGARMRARDELESIFEYQKKTYAAMSTARHNAIGYMAIGSMALNVDRIDMARKCFGESYRYFAAAYPKDSVWYFAGFKGENAMADLRIREIRSAESNIAHGKLSLLAAKGPNPHLTNAEAEFLLAKGEPDSAIALWSKPPSLQFGFAGTLWVQLVTTNVVFRRDGPARAYVKKGEIDAAIREYERITTFDPATPDRRLIHPLDRYELAKLYEKKGLKEKAIVQYEKFLSFWKNADRDRPEPKDARVRLAKLRS